MEFLEAYRAQRSGGLAGGLSFAAVEKVMQKMIADDADLQQARISLLDLHLRQERGAVPVLNFESSVRLALLVRYWVRSEKKTDYTWAEFMDYFVSVSSHPEFDASMRIIEKRIVQIGGLPDGGSP